MTAQETIDRLAPMLDDLEARTQAVLTSSIGSVEGCRAEEHLYALLDRLLSEWDRVRRA